MLYRLLFTTSLLALPGMAAAQTVVDPKDVTAGDVVAKPLEDINLKKDEIPAILLVAREKPYDLAGLRGCAALQGEVQRLTAALGEDIDVAQGKSLWEKRSNSVGGFAKSVVGSLIPFSGVIREVSGANENQRQWNIALYAGSVRRAFLKGYGQQKGCRYPARAAGPADVEAVRETHDAKPEQPVPDTKPVAETPAYESRPVVQPVPRKR